MATKAKDCGFGIDQVKFALQTAVVVASAADFIPGLKTAAELSLTIVDVARTVKNNKQDCVVVANRAVQLVMAMVETTRGLTAVDLDPSLQTDMERLSADLGEIRDILIEQASRSTFARVLNHISDVDNINRCKEMLDHSFKTFQVYSTMALRLQIARLRANPINQPSDFSPTQAPRGPDVKYQVTRPIRNHLLIHDTANPRHSFDILSPHMVIYNCQRYPTGFHLYQSLKFKSDIAEHIRTCSDDPDDAYQIARQYIGMVRLDWDQMRTQTMDQVIWCKFAQHPNLLQELLATGNAKIINNTEHPFWGTGPMGGGPNEWGKAFERLRTTIRAFGVGESHSSDRCSVMVFGSPNPHPSFDLLSLHPVVYNGLRYPTSFHLYQSLKFPAEIGEKIRTYSEDPSDIDKLQRQYFTEVRVGWDEVRVHAWDQALWCKFTQHTSLLQELLSTGSAEIIHDTGHMFWGVGPSGGGQNEAGKALGRLRSRFSMV